MSPAPKISQIQCHDVNVSAMTQTAAEFWHWPHMSMLSYYRAIARTDIFGEFLARNVDVAG